MESMKKTNKLDRILTAEEELVPSSGFVASVMERVREEAAAPEPIPFPWKRVVPAQWLQSVGGVVWWCKWPGRGCRICPVGFELWAKVPQQMTGGLDRRGMGRGSVGSFAAVVAAGASADRPERVAVARI